MAFCPECGQEYPADVVACRSCRVVLEEGQPGPMLPRDPEVIKLVSLGPVDSLVEGSMLRGALESQGLHPRLVSYSLPAIGEVPRDWGTMHWGELRVPEDEAAEARLVLEDFRQALTRMPPLGEAPAEDDESKEESDGRAL
jgi:hypothetical protein